MSSTLQREIIGIKTFQRTKKPLKLRTYNAVVLIY